MAYAIVTLASKTITNVTLVSGNWADALTALAERMEIATVNGFRTSVKGTWVRPYARRGECPKPTSFSAYTKGYCEFVYIKKVVDGLTEDEVFNILAYAQEEKNRSSRTTEQEMAGLLGVRAPRSAEERDEFWHCYEMGDFDY